LLEKRQTATNQQRSNVSSHRFRFRVVFEPLLSNSLHKDAIQRCRHELHPDRGSGRRAADAERKPRYLYAQQRCPDQPANTLALLWPPADRNASLPLPGTISDADTLSHRLCTRSGKPASKGGGGHPARHTAARLPLSRCRRSSAQSAQFRRYLR
uniref:Uncharacterized protein n=1 Tax=Anopheles coluzzii TaxID=1518534 RepID=A0A8W7Q3D2_ANOCL